MENGEELSPQTAINTTQNDDWQATGRTRSNSASSGHKRSVSGSLLSKLSFLRMSQSSSADNNEALSSRSHGDEIAGNLNPNDEHNPTNNDGYIGGSRAGGTSRAMATAIQHQRKMRRRRGSLRKTALLGTRLELKEKRSSSNASAAREQVNYGIIENSRGVSSSPLSSSADTGGSRTTPPPASTTTLTDEELTPRGSMDRDSGGHSSIYSGYWPRSLTMDRGDVSTEIKSRTSIGDTTDEEDNISLSNFNKTTSNNSTTSNERTASTHLRPSSVSSSGSINPPLIATPSSSSESYFLPSHHHLHHHHQTSSANEATDATTRPLGRPSTTHRARSPLIAPELSSNTSNTLDPGVGVSISGGTGWDYSETEWWGWIILLVTWLVFVVGIGSSFGVWSWAWDVGETPYAPPELEDDPTLPIVGYYPALMVLTAVMAWVWVVVAWVGMKYFKHANIAADDG